MSHTIYANENPQIYLYINPSQEADLMANKYYINVSSDAYPEGEIRGQLLKKLN